MDDPFAKYMRHHKQRAKSINNAELAGRYKTKHVLFSTTGDISVSGLSTSSTISNSLSDSEDDTDLAVKGNSAAPTKKSVNFKDTDVYIEPAKSGMAQLQRFRSYPHLSTFMAPISLLDTTFFSPQQLTLTLPEFNKRPLTDTPIVLGAASPVTGEPLSESESDTDEITLTQKPSIRKKKVISHLSLADLNAVSAKVASVANRNADTDSISPTNTKEGNVADSDIGPLDTPSVELAAASVAKAAEGPKTPKFTVSPSDDKNIDASVLEHIREDLLQDVPPEVLRQFVKTPLFEKLKNILLLKQTQKTKKAYTLNIPGQTSSKTSPDGKIASVDVGSKLVIVMVGLPARGKSYITNKLTRYLNWIQHDCRVFNVGNTRRMDKNNVLGPAHRPLPDTSTPLPHLQSPAVQPFSPTSHSADFFNPKNSSSTELREKWAMDTLDSLLNWVIDGSGSVGILDATNLTKKRRLKVLKRIQERSNGELKVLFLESICSDPAILDTNIRLKLSGPDYKTMDPELALRDFLGRLRNYESAYETIDEEEEALPGFQYVKMINVGKKVVSYNIQGFLASQTIYFLLNFNLCERQIWLTRHGESIDNLSGRIGGDSGLTKRGQKFAKALSRFLNYQRHAFRRKQLESFSTRLELHYNEITGKVAPSGLQEKQVVQVPTEPNFCVWTSMLLRAIETGNYFNDQEYNVKAMRMLNELGGGKFDGMTYDEIRRKHPKEFESRIRNKLTYRYPGVGGESYLDVLVRLRPVINEIERTTDHLLIVSHRVVLRVLLAYFMNLDKSAIVELDVPLHTLYCLELKPYGTEYAMYEYDEVTDWFRKIEPEHQKNVKEVGVNFRERKYSVIPTAPPTTTRRGTRAGVDPANMSKNASFSVRKSINSSDNLPREGMLQRSLNSLSSRKLADLNKMRMP